MSTEAPNSVFAPVEVAIEEIRAGRFVVVVDDEDRENEGDLTIAAQFVTPEAVNFMATHGRGLICLCLTPERCEELGLRQMTDQNETPFGTAFTVSIEARDGVSTGISAADRARTIQVAIDPTSTPHDLVQPGHVFPLRARTGGVLQRSGQTEAAVDLARLAGLAPAGVVCEIMNEDGTMARVSDLIPYCEQHDLKMVTVADLIEYRRRHEKLVQRVASVRLPTAIGVFQAVAYEEVLTGKHHIALVKGDVDGAQDVLVRVHSECLTGDVFHSQRCDCGEQLDQALRRIEEEGTGVLLYLAQEGRGIGLLNKLRAYELQEQGLDTVEANLRLGFAADAREYGIGSQILADLGLTTIRVLSNNPQKITGISGFGLSVVAHEPIEIEPNPENQEYLDSKRDRMGHTIGQREHHQRVRFDPKATDRGARLHEMSDRYDSPRWDDEPTELGTSETVAEESEAAETDEPDLDASSENVLDGWPLADVTPSEEDVVDEAAGSEAAVAAPAAADAVVAGVASPPADEPEAPPPFADHVSATMEHAPGDLTVPPGYSVLEGEAAGERRAVGVVVARFNGDVTTLLLESALAELEACGVSRDAVTVMPVPGAFELPLAAMALAKTRRFACIVALGCVIRGDTPHFDYVSSEAASGLQLAAIETGVPVAFGVLTLDRADQAESRTGKGAEAVRTGLEMADLFANLRAAAAR